IDNQQVLQMDDLIAYLARSTKVDQKVTLTILRDGKQQTLDVTLAARPSTEQRATANHERGVTLGILGRTVDEAIAREMKLPSGQQGVLVEEVQSGSLADEAGLRGGERTVTLGGQQIKVGGDVITALNGQSIANMQELKAALAQPATDQELSLTILRNGVEMEIALRQGQ
ncbi:MAG TPA: PDZ domain-containing protein, partial [Anaerolineales bacterium]|nr:PDZ domain-containing protein [Anaerolineales bacterium]